MQIKLTFLTVRVAVKIEHIKVLFHTTKPKNQHFATTTLKFGLAKCSVTISYGCSRSGPKHLATGTPRQGDRILEPATRVCDAYPRPKSRSTTVYHTETSHGQVAKIPGQAQYFTTVFCRHQEQDAAGQG